MKHLNQDDWKRTQVRMPQEQYQAVVDYANDNKMSLNSAIIDLVDKGLLTSPTDQSDLLKQILTEIQSLKKPLD
ncbi:hypothetical protein AAX06_01400 [Moraxella bovoculi]|uniref:Arc family DNA-binding protein n=1 Tax=Moraxella bovoculi TaxID=386891 RepID=A0AAC8T974_9GAMM|nr:hypothetical protein [Moraxella bovoculi]AKG07056.1 hypothetical protein AAX06_01400 [Moraxella bovoculi]AKG12193.1 hypothetical protein AAX07_09665 [Moraxella bovoculi]